MNTAVWKPTLRATAVTALVGLAAGIGAHLLPFDVDIHRRASVSGEDGVAGARVNPGNELLMVIIGSCTCGWSASHELPSVIAEGRRTLRARAAERSSGFATLGVAQDEAPRDGLKYLSRFGDLDELAVGRGWRNSVIRRYVYSDFPGPAATPQVVILTRSITGTPGEWNVANERVVLRKVGLSAIKTWAAAGANLPNWPVQATGEPK